MLPRIHVDFLEGIRVTVVHIGLLGCGSIGGFLARHVLAEATIEPIELSYVYDVDENRMQDIPPPCRITAQADLFTRPADLVVEAAHADLVKAVALRIVERSDLLLFSLTALADDAFRTALEQTAVEHKRKVFLPHGAIIGVDGLVDAGPTLKSVTVTTTKSPASLGLPPGSYKVVYEGPVREACAKFPRNVNVHAAIALAGLGFDRTISRIVADPAVSTNSHLVEVEGTGYQFRIQVSSEAGGKVTGAYTPQSALNTLRRICRGKGGLRFV
jgi:aspartate dehydrogenase